MLRQESLASVCVMLLMLGGCPKRQDRRSVVVYVPSTPSAAVVNPDAPKQEVLVIEQPTPPEPQVAPEESSPPKSSTPRAARRRTGPARGATPAEADETAVQDSPTTLPAEVPTLEPRETTAHENELRQQYQKLADDVRQRLERINGSQLPVSDRRTFEDARTFFVQSAHASASGDLPRALNLVRKASLLLAALE